MFDFVWLVGSGSDYDDQEADTSNVGKQKNDEPDEDDSEDSEEDEADKGPTLSIEDLISAMQAKVLLPHLSEHFSTENYSEWFPFT